MKTKKVQFELPISLYAELAEIAEASDSTMEDVLVQTIKCGMPPSLSKVPDEFHTELLPLNRLADKDLLRIVEGDWPAPKKQSELHRKADFASLRRTYALSLLRWRGHPIPTPFEM